MKWQVKGKTLADEGGCGFIRRLNCEMGYYIVVGAIHESPERLSVNLQPRRSCRNRQNTKSYYLIFLVSISSFARLINSSAAIAPRSPSSPLRRTETSPFSTSLSPIMSI